MEPDWLSLNKFMLVRKGRDVNWLPKRSHRPTAPSRIDVSYGRKSDHRQTHSLQIAITPHSRFLSVLATAAVSMRMVMMMMMSITYVRALSVDEVVVCLRKMSNGKSSSNTGKGRVPLFRCVQDGTELGSRNKMIPVDGETSHLNEMLRVWLSNSSYGSYMEHSAAGAKCKSSTGNISGLLDDCIKLLE